MKESFPNLAKEIDFQKVQEAQRVPKKLDPRRNTPRHIIKLPKIKDKERILKAARKRRQLPTEEFLSDCQLISLVCRPVLNALSHTSQGLISQKKSYRQDEAGKKY